MSTLGLLGEIAGVGRDARRGGYSRHGFDHADIELRTWFVEQAFGRDLDVRTDRNGNLWAWWGTPGPDAVVTGSHLDSVPGGGAFDGPLGVAAALDAVDMLRAAGTTPRKPLAVVVFAEEEGGRFGVPCLGSRLMTGSIDPDAARRLTDSDGVTLAEAARSVGVYPDGFGTGGFGTGGFGTGGFGTDGLEHVGCFVELHVEQGRLLDRMSGDHAVALATSILPHGRWRFTVTGEGNHAGTTDPADRHDPMLPAATAIAAARKAMADQSGARATIGRFTPNPGGANVIASAVEFWLDARAASTDDTRAIVRDVSDAVREAAVAEGCRLTVREESYGDTVTFDPGLRTELAELLGGVPDIPTGAGHDAGVLAGRVPTAMLFVRNPTGISHSPAEHAEPADCVAGAEALAKVLEHLCR
jgi:N-carbamoyl-L-amino-acid hydrolase